MFVTFGKRGGGHFIVRIDHIVTITDVAENCEVCWIAANETYRTPIGNKAEDALRLIEFAQEKNRRAALKAVLP